MGTQETKIYIAILIAAMVLGTVLIYFIITILRQQKSNYALHQLKIQAEIITLEKERARMARDLHDDLAPALLALRYNFNSFELSDPQDLVTVRKSSEVIDTLTARMREIANDLLPEALLRKGLVMALAETTDEVQTRSGIRVSFTHLDVPDIEMNRSVHIYRIVQEILHNTVKHAKASILTIELKISEKMLLLETRDNGPGFNKMAVLKESKGLGLRSLLSRADMLGGNMYLDTETGKGTHYLFEIPV